LAVIASLAVAASAASAPRPSFAGKWSGTYTKIFRQYPCAGYGCTPDSPAYCSPTSTDPKCRSADPPKGVCPDFQLTGTAVVAIKQTGSHVHAAISLVGAMPNMGPECSVRAHSNTSDVFDGTAAGATASGKLAYGGAGKLTLSGKALTGSFSDEYGRLSLRLAAK